MPTVFQVRPENSENSITSVSSSFAFAVILFHWDSCNVCQYPPFFWRLLPTPWSSYLSRCLVMFLVFLAFSSLECKMEMFKCMPITHFGIATFPHPCWVHPCQYSTGSSIPPVNILPVLLLLAKHYSQAFSHLLCEVFWRPPEQATPPCRLVLPSFLLPSFIIPILVVNCCHP